MESVHALKVMDSGTLVTGLFSSSVELSGVPHERNSFCMCVCVFVCVK